MTIAAASVPAASSAVVNANMSSNLDMKPQALLSLTVSWSNIVGAVPAGSAFTYIFTATGFSSTSVTCKAAVVEYGYAYDNNYSSEVSFTSKDGQTQSIPITVDSAGGETDSIFRLKIVCFGSFLDYSGYSEYFRISDASLVSPAAGTYLTPFVDYTAQVKINAKLSCSTVTVEQWSKDSDMFVTRTLATAASYSGAGTVLTYTVAGHARTSSGYGEYFYVSCSGFKWSSPVYYIKAVPDITFYGPAETQVTVTSGVLSFVPSIFDNYANGMNIRVKVELIEKGYISATDSTVVSKSYIHTMKNTLKGVDLPLPAYLP